MLRVPLPTWVTSLYQEVIQEFIMSIYHQFRTARNKKSEQLAQEVPKAQSPKNLKTPVDSWADTNRSS